MFNSKDLLCASCGYIKNNDNYRYCRSCHERKDKLNRCTGITRKGERCSHLTENEKCIYHAYYNKDIKIFF